MLIYAQTWHPTQKPVGVTPCQFDSDLQHHDFRHEKDPQTMNLRVFVFRLSDT